MQTQSLKQTYYKDDDVHFEIERCGGEIFIHCTVTKWSLSVLRRAYHIFSQFIIDSQNKGFKRIITLSPNPRFAKLFGGSTIYSLIQNNIEYEVIEWDLKLL